MSTVAKILVVLNLILAAAFLASAASYLGNQDHWAKKYSDRETYWKGEVANREIQIKDRDNKIGTLNRQANEALEAKTAAEAQAAKDRSQNEMLRENHRQVSGSLTSATRSLEAAQATIASDQTLIGQLQEQRQKLTEAIKVANDAKDAAVRQLNALQVANDNLAREKDALQASVAELQKSLERAEFQLRSFREKFGSADIPTDQPPSHQGRVLAIDPATNVVVVSLGAEDKVKEGFRYIVARGTSYVGTIEIRNVEAKKSSGKSVKDLEKSPIEVGDVIIPR